LYARLSGARLPCMGELTDQIVAQATVAPTAAALKIMRISVMDWLACGIAGWHEPVVGIVAGMLDVDGGQAQATCFDGKRRSGRAAALLNGTASHALDYDDTHFMHIGHVSVGVLPAALAMAELESCTIDSFISAGLAGSEGAIRMGVALGRDHYQIGFHQTATSGAFGATLAASLLATTDKIAQAHALGIASTRAAGLKSQFGTMGKPYNAGLAAQTGVEATLLAVRGMVSNPNGWDGPQGVIATQHGSGETLPDGFLMPAISHKFHACCHGLHATLEAIQDVLPLDPTSIDHITISTHPRWMSVCNKPDPKTGLEAKFSYKAVVAFAVLGHSTAALKTFDDDLLKNRDVHEMMDRVTVTADENLTEMQAKVTIWNRTEHAASHILDAVSVIAVREKRVLAKAAALIGEAQTTAIWETLTKSGHRPISDLTQHLR
jgi:2-methylcitrate dehydratase PrpD